MSIEKVEAFERKYQELLATSSQTMKSLIEDCSRRDKEKQVKSDAINKELITKSVVGLRNLAKFSQTKTVASACNQMSAYGKNIVSDFDPNPNPFFLGRKFIGLTTFTIFLDSNGLQIHGQWGRLQNLGKNFTLTSTELAKKIKPFRLDVYTFGCERRLAKDLVALSKSPNIEKEVFIWLFETLSSYSGVPRIIKDYEAGVVSFFHDAGVRLEYLKKIRN